VGNPLSRLVGKVAEPELHGWAERTAASRREADQAGFE